MASATRQTAGQMRPFNNGAAEAGWREEVEEKGRINNIGQFIVWRASKMRQR